MVKEKEALPEIILEGTVRGVGVDDYLASSGDIEVGGGARDWGCWKRCGLDWVGTK